MGRCVRRGNALRFPKGETQAEARARKRLAVRRTRQELVRYVRERDRHHCRLTGRRVQYDDDSQPDYGEVHEFVPRGRGGSATDPRNCLLLSKATHTLLEPCVHPQAFHRTRRVIVPLDADALMEGPVTFRDEPMGHRDQSGVQP